MHSNTQHQELVSELKHVKELLQEKELIFDNILEGSLAGFWDWNIPEGKSYLSPTYKRMLGYKVDELNGENEWQSILHPDDLPGVLEVFNNHVKSKGKIPYTNEVRYFHKDGSIVWVYCEGKVIEWDENDNAIRMVGCHVNVTKKKELEQKEKENLILQQKNNELEQLAYITSHDLQEPVNSIKSFAELIIADNENILSDTSQQMLGYVAESADRMGKLILGLLEHSNIGLHRKEEVVNCENLVDDIIKDLDKVIHDTNTTFEIHTLPNTLIGNETELRLLFQNIFTNAIKFHKENIPPHIVIMCKPYAEFFQFEITDHGIGIDEGNYDKIFNIFSKLNLYSKYEGTGIGLAHCKKIVDLHKGKIWVESKVNEKTTFYIQIPR